MGMPVNNVSWFLPGGKKAVAYSTEVVREVIMALARDCETVDELMMSMRYDKDVCRVLGEYVSRGYGLDDPEECLASDVRK